MDHDGAKAECRDNTMDMSYPVANRGSKNCGLFARTDTPIWTWAGGSKAAM